MWNLILFQLWCARHTDSLFLVQLSLCMQGISHRTRATGTRAQSKHSLHQGSCKVGCVGSLIFNRTKHLGKCLHGYLCVSAMLASIQDALLLRTKPGLAKLYVCYPCNTDQFTVCPGPSMTLWSVEQTLISK